MPPDAPDTSDLPGAPAGTSPAAPATPLAAEAHPIRLDPVIHERFRLAILCALAAHEQMSFIDLTRYLGMTYGNLHIHAKRLEEVGYLESVKHGERRENRTTFSITRAGRKALERYFAQMTAIMAAARRT